MGVGASRTRFGIGFFYFWIARELLTFSRSLTDELRWCSLCTHPCMAPLCPLCALGVPAKLCLLRARGVPVICRLRAYCVPRACWLCAAVCPLFLLPRPRTSCVSAVGVCLFCGCFVKVMKGEGGALFEMKQVDAMQRWYRRFVEVSFTDKRLNVDNAVILAGRVKSVTQHSDHEKQEEERQETPHWFTAQLPAFSFGFGRWNRQRRRRPKPLKPRKASGDEGEEEEEDKNNDQCDQSDWNDESDWGGAWGWNFKWKDWASDPDLDSDDTPYSEPRIRDRKKK